MEQDARKGEGYIEKKRDRELCMRREKERGRKRGIWSKGERERCGDEKEREREKNIGRKREREREREREKEMEGEMEQDGREKGEKEKY